MSPPAFTARTLRTLIVGLATALFLLVVSSRPVDAHAIRKRCRASPWSPPSRLSWQSFKRKRRAWRCSSPSTA